MRTRRRPGPRSGDRAVGVHAVSALRGLRGGRGLTGAARLRLRRLRGLRRGRGGLTGPAARRGGLGDLPFRGGLRGGTVFRVRRGLASTPSAVSTAASAFLAAVFRTRFGFSSASGRTPARTAPGSPRPRRPCGSGDAAWPQRPRPCPRRLPPSWRRSSARASASPRPRRSRGRVRLDRDRLLAGAAGLGLGGRPIGAFGGVDGGLRLRGSLARALRRGLGRALDGLGRALGGVDRRLGGLGRLAGTATARRGVLRRSGLRHDGLGHDGLGGGRRNRRLLGHGRGLLRRPAGAATARLLGGGGVLGGPGGLRGLRRRALGRVDGGLRGRLLHRAHGGGDPAAGAATAARRTRGLAGLRLPGVHRGRRGGPGARLVERRPATRTATAARRTRRRLPLLGTGTTASVTAVPAAASARSAPADLAQVLDLLRVQTGPGALRPGQDALGALGDAEVRVEVRGGGVGLGRVAEIQVERLVDQLPAGMSSQSTSVIAVPFAPARPVRPMRCRYVFSSSGVW